MGGWVSWDEECAYSFSPSRGVLNIPRCGVFGIGSYSAVLLLCSSKDDGVHEVR